MAATRHPISLAAVSAPAMYRALLASAAGFETMPTRGESALAGIADKAPTAAAALITSFNIFQPPSGQVRSDSNWRTVSLKSRNRRPAVKHHFLVMAALISHGDRDLRRTGHF